MTHFYIKLKHKMKDNLQHIFLTFTSVICSFILISPHSVFLAASPFKLNVMDTFFCSFSLNVPFVQTLVCSAAQSEVTETLTTQTSSFTSETVCSEAA